MIADVWCLQGSCVCAVLSVTCTVCCLVGGCGLRMGVVRFALYFVCCVMVVVCAWLLVVIRRLPAVSCVG